MSKAQPELPLEPAVKPSGRLYVVDQRRPFTIPLSRSVTDAKVVGRWSENDRKLWAFLVASAFDELGAPVPVHTVNYRKVAALFRSLGPVRNGTEWVLESARHLQQSNFLWENSAEVGSTTLLSGIKINKKTGEISFAFDPFLKQMLLRNEVFSRLKLHFIIGLQGKYCVSLYILLQGYVNRRHSICELELDQLREALAVPTGRLTRYIDLMKNAVLPALEQINSAPQKSGFTVEFEPILTGRRVTGARFVVTKFDDKSNEAVPLPDLGADENHFPVSHPAGIILDVDEALRIIRQELRGVDAQAALADFRSEIEGREIEKPLGYLTVWCRARAGNNKKTKSLIDKAAKARRIVD